jgi:hypothetical protein
VPADDECRNDGLTPAGRSAKEIEYRDLPLHRIDKPAVIRRIRVGAHESVVYDIITRVYLLVSRALIVISRRERPFSGTRCGSTRARPFAGA